MTETVERIQLRQLVDELPDEAVAAAIADLKLRSTERARRAAAEADQLGFLDSVRADWGDW